jgi:hypothetical protein
VEERRGSWKKKDVGGGRKAPGEVEAARGLATSRKHLGGSIEVAELVVPRSSLTLGLRLAIPQVLLAQS